MSTDPIPVELISFTASLNDASVQLNWQTATETNNAGFEILRSTDNNNFNRVSFVEGAGNSTAPKFYSFIDSEVQSGENYFYKLKQTDFDGSYDFSNTIEVQIPFPEIFSLEQNYPNPFNPTTRIKFEIPGQARNANTLVTLKVYDVLGNEVAILVNEEKPAGKYEVTFDASQLSSGIYFYTLKAGTFVETKKLILLK
ncbi:MAG: T9SS type A sorting domain-containing protein [Ignavibacteriales bacterium]|nr:T9SS type A sorting domain-containing protein [Ignavibacteriales bacterium]